MNLDSITKSAIYALIFIALPLLSDHLSGKVLKVMNIPTKSRFYFRILVSSLQIILFFLVYMFFLNVLNIDIEYLNFAGLILLPISVICFFVFLFLFLYSRFFGDDSS